MKIGAIGGTGRPVMELRHLRYFSAVAETLSFTRAAERLHVTQSTLSHQIRQLEDSLGTQLFDRVGKKVRLTEAGETFLSHIEPVLRQVDGAVRAIQRTDETPVPILRVGTIPSFNIQIMPQCVCHYLAREPDNRVVVEELLLEDIVNGLTSDRLNLAVSYMPPSDNDIWFEPLYKEELVLVVSSSHPFASRRRIRMAELHKMRMAMLVPELRTRQLADEGLAMAGAVPFVVAQLNTAPSAIELVRNSDLATIVAASSFKASPDLCLVPLQDPTPVRAPGLMWKKGAMGSAAVREFADVIRSMVPTMQETRRRK